MKYSSEPGVLRGSFPPVDIGELEGGRSIRVLVCHERDGFRHHASGDLRSTRHFSIAVSMLSTAAMIVPELMQRMTSEPRRSLFVFRGSWF